jgi:hypothetical protein
MFRWLLQSYKSPAKTHDKKQGKKTKREKVQKAENKKSKVKK